MTPLIVAVRFRKQAWCGCFVAFAILPKNLIDRALCLTGAAVRDATRRRGLVGASRTQKIRLAELQVAESETVAIRRGCTGGRNRLPEREWTMTPSEHSPSSRDGKQRKVQPNSAIDAEPSL